MERIIPYHSCFKLGYGVDVTKFPLQSGERMVPEDHAPVIAEPHSSKANFSFVESMKDVCDVLEIPPEYALKVQAHLVVNDVVFECLKDVCRRDVITLVFRMKFLQRKIFFPETFDKKAEGSGELPASDEPKAKEGYDHLVRAVEIGNELVAILKISTHDRENFDKFSKSLEEALACHKGIMDEYVFSKLEEFAKSFEKKIKKKHYQDVKCSIQYGCYTDKVKYPASPSGMVKTLKEFSDKCVGWTHLSGDFLDNTVGAMILMDGMEEEKKGVFSTISNAFKQKNDGDTNVKMPVEACSDVDGGTDSFVVLASETDHMYYMRVSLQSVDEPEDSEIESFTSFALSQYPETSKGQFEKLFVILLKAQKAAEKLQRLFGSKQFMCGDRVKEGNDILRSVQNIHMEVSEAIRKLNMVIMPSDEFMETLGQANPLQTVENYIENVMYKIPPGCDLDLLIIGKTGHGKSSTGNAILGQEKFLASASAESVTKNSAIAWGNVDGRILRVVDTPGVCDTSEDKDSIEQAIDAISEAISHCQGGFHALLLVIRFGQRMTMEERKAIGMLKCILGENVIKTHCVCVITHGDNFESEFEGSVKFEEWCRNQSGYLKDIFEECQYRCLLFNNKAKDQKKMKGQLIRLVETVDSLQSSGTRYTNALFQFAQQQRQQIVADKHMPQVSHEMMRDIELVLDHLKRVANNTDKRDKYEAELENLKGMVDNLSNRVTEVEGDQVKLLVETVFSLAEVIHAEIDKIGDRPTPDAPDNLANGSSHNEEGATAASNDEEAPLSLALQAQTKNLEDFRDTQMVAQANEVDNEVRDKVKEEIKSKDNCFPACSKVVLKNGMLKSLEHLEVGEEVLVRNAKGSLCFDTVYMFGHRDPDSKAEFVVIHVGDQLISVSGNHLVFCVRDNLEMYLPAKDVKIGDELFVLSHDHLKFKFMPVFQLTRERKRGLFAPFTHCGTIVVDGSVMSCYVDVLPHSISHALLSPMRQLYRLSPSALAFLNGGVQNKDIPVWAKLALKWV